MKKTLFLKTADQFCQFSLQQDDHNYHKTWLAGRNLSDKLLEQLQTFLKENGLAFDDLTGIVVFRGPGSYTGLRIGLTVANTLAGALAIPIVGTETESWQELGRARLAHGDNDQIATPIYLQPAIITQPKK